jgi:DNA-binding PadR family transcriptional regulator
MDVPNHRERQFMQHLRAGGWLKASAAPAGEKLIENLLAKGWIEKREITANEVSYRLTDKGLAAKKAPVRVYD